MQTSVPEVTRPRRRARPRLRPVRPGRAQAGDVRGQLPAGPAAGRARRPVHPALSPRLGPPRRPARRHPPALPRDRPGLRGPDHRPEAAGHARRHPGALGRRVRPHQLQPGQADGRPTTAATTTPAASPPGRPAAGSSRASPTARPTRSATTSPPTASTSTTSTPPSCRLLGVDHERLTYKHQGRYYRLTDVSGRVVREYSGLTVNHRFVAWPVSSTSWMSGAAMAAG